ncbi:MAG: WYL domain-containing protein [Clostridia bacterium]|nr:WYL domain-containing protein [Clostridia bacterium]
MKKDSVFHINGDVNGVKVANLKQHINLSYAAYQTIEEDSKIFSNGDDPTLGGFLNRIFLNFYEEADASITERYWERYEELEQLFSSREFDSMDKTITDTYVVKIAGEREKELIKKSRSYEKGHKFKININKGPLDIIRSSGDASYYNGIIGQYLKAIYEEYAAKPLFEREAIAFKDVVEKINSAKEQKKRIKLSLIKRIDPKSNEYKANWFYFLPYGIMQGKASLFSYAVGYFQRIEKDGTLGEWKVASVRISRIDFCKVQSKSYHLSKAECKQIEDDIAGKGVEYLAGDTKKIKVRFTDFGLEQFSQHLFQRPNDYKVSSEDKSIYVFNCTPFQAKNYFFKFGADAEIIEPDDLRKEIAAKYRDAYMRYEGK